MSIYFNYYPGIANYRKPGVFIEVNSNLANTASQLQQTLIIGQASSSGNATANTPVLVASLADAKAKFGINSMLTKMYYHYSQVDTLGTVWCLPVSNSGATATVKTITFTATSPAAGTIPLYVQGISIPVAVTTASTASTIATAVAAAINAKPYVPVTATASTGVVTLTVNEIGLTAGDLDIRFAYAGSIAGEAMPSGVTAVVATTTAGATDPDLTAGLAALGPINFNFIVNPYSSSTQTASITTLLSENGGRWSPTVLQCGQAFTAVRGNAGSLQTWGAAINDPYQNAIGFYDGPQPSYVWAAVYAAACAVAIKADAGSNLRTISLPGILPPPATSLFTNATQNTLLFNGVSTFNVVGNTIVIDRAITTYQKNGAGQPDNSYLDTITPATLTAVIRSYQTWASKYARMKLVDDATPISAAANVTNSKAILADAIGNYRQLLEQYLVQDIDTFKANATAQNAGGGQVSLYLPVNIINQLESIAINLSFIKS